MQTFVDEAVVNMQLNDPEHFNTFSSDLGENMHCAVRHTVHHMHHTLYLPTSYVVDATCVCAPRSSPPVGLGSACLPN